MILRCKTTLLEYSFQQIPLTFEAGTRRNIFGEKNNKTLTETLDHPRYAKLRTEIVSRYFPYLSWPLGTFLLDLKRKQDTFYKRFLNAYGDLEYSRFLIADRALLNRKGVYAYTVGDGVAYIGRCRDSIAKRINLGYGRINPKNCFLDGQATNCHLNALITSEIASVGFWLHAIDSVDEIADIERRLVRAYRPVWNIHKFE